MSRSQRETSSGGETRDQTQLPEPDRELQVICLLGSMLLFSLEILLNLKDPDLRTFASLRDRYRGEILGKQVWG